MQDTDDQVLDDWCGRETAYWSRLATGKRDFELDFERLSETYHGVFVLDIRDGRVSVRPKCRKSAKGIKVSAQEITRIDLYRQYIEESLRGQMFEGPVTIAIDTHDLPREHSNSPVFCFQKTIKSRHILLPDVDFMQHGWYENVYGEPTLADKVPRATFVGSSTGGGILSHADVAEARPPRLHLARALHGHARIDFSIAAAVQCDTPATEALLRQQPYFSAPVSWETQLQSKFLISIDGNGATCSRVVNSLRSQSVLVKFTSPHRLYYTHGLEAWRHYIPVDTPADLERLMKEDTKGHIAVETIVREANLFFDRFLSRAAVHRYGARLLHAYARDIAPKGRPDLARRRAENNLIDGLCAHVANIGDVRGTGGEWTGDPDRCQPVEGLSIEPAAGVDPTALRYRCLTAGGEPAEWSPLGVFSGSRGQARPVTGIELSPSRQSDGPVLAGLVRFANGTVRTIGPRGGLYREADDSPIVALRLWLS